MSMNESIATAREAEVNAALSRQANAIDILGNTVQRVWEKVKPSLREEPLGGDAKDEKLSLVPLVREISAQTIRIERIAENLQDLISLCEL